MGRLDKFLRLSATDRRLLVKAMLFVWMVRMGLWLLPFRIVRRLLARLTHGSTGAPASDCTLVNRIVWAVTIASRYVPMATCLTQALATKMLLCRYGYPASVHIGVARSEGGQFQAHAWVESNGSVVIGGSEAALKRYTLLMTSDGDLE